MSSRLARRFPIVHSRHSGRALRRDFASTNRVGQRLAPANWLSDGSLAQRLIISPGNVRLSQGIALRMIESHCHAIRKDLVSALEKENRKLSPDTLLIWSWLFWLSHCLQGLAA